MQMVTHAPIAMPDLPLAAATEFTTDTNVVDMSKYHRCRIVLALNQSGAGTGAVVLKQSSLADGSDEKALTFAEYWKNETGVTTSVFTRVDASTLTTAGPTTGLNVYAFEVKSDALDTDNGFQYLRLDLTTLANNVAAVLHYEIYEPRYPTGTDACQNAVA